MFKAGLEPVTSGFQVTGFQAQTIRSHCLRYRKKHSWKHTFYFDMFRFNVYKTAWYTLYDRVTSLCTHHHNVPVVSRFWLCQHFSKNKGKQQQTCNSILALSFVFLVICFRLMSAPVRVAFPAELQSPIYVGRPGVPVSYNREMQSMESLPNTPVIPKLQKFWVLTYVFFLKALSKIPFTFINSYIWMTVFLPQMGFQGGVGSIFTGYGKIYNIYLPCRQH